MRNTVTTRTELLKFASMLSELALAITSNVKAAGNNIDALHDVLLWSIADTYQLAHELKARKKPLFRAAEKI